MEMIDSGVTSAELRGISMESRDELSVSKTGLEMYTLLRTFRMRTSLDNEFPVSVSSTSTAKKENL